MHLAIISPFTAIFAVSLLMAVLLVGITLSQFYYDFKHPDRKIDWIVHATWLTSGILILCVINVFAYKNTNKENVLTYLCCILGMVMVFGLIHSWMDRMAYKFDVWLHRQKNIDTHRV